MTLEEVAIKNLRSFLRSATFKCETSQEAAFACVDVLAEALAAAPKAQPVQGWQDIPVTDETLGYVMQYGGRCRDCADAMGICPNSGLPCVADEARAAIRQTLHAINYGFTNGFLKLPLPAGPSSKEGL